MITAADVEGFERAIAAGGVALFPADTVYGLAADPESGSAVERLYALKGRPADKPGAVLFFTLESALDSLSWLGERTRAALERLFPGAYTLLVPNPERRFPLACGPAPERLGVRVPALEGELEPLASATIPVFQSSANPAGGVDARRVADVDEEIRAGVDFTLDGGQLPGVHSTVVDMTAYEESCAFEVVREGAVTGPRVAELIGRV